MRFLTDFVWRCKTLVIPLVAIIVAVTILFFTGHKDAAWIVAYPGSFLVVVVNLFYIAIFDSRKRWPGRSWAQRLGRAMTFKR